MPERNRQSTSGGPARPRRRSRAPQQGAGRTGAPRGSARGGARPADTGSDEPSLIVTGTPAPPAVTTFAELDLPTPLSEELTRQGVSVPFPIQGATLPSSLAGRDVLGRGRTGSGKTLAFGLAMLARTAGHRAEPRRPLALVLVPTRELAQQVTDSLTPYARALHLRMATVVGGLSIGRQAAALRGGAEIVVATPGRLRDLVERGDCALDQVVITVLDEADQMADMGFLPQVTALLRQVVPGSQRMLFSATLDRNVDTLVRRFLSDPVVHAVDPSAGAVSTMEHHVLHVTGEDKRDATVRIAARDGRVLLFLDSKRAVDRLAKTLLASGVRAAALHGGKSQPQRTRTLTQFKSGEVTALVATNVAARGIHIDDLDLVVNVDPPADHKDYLHRGGRTARAGASGRVVTLVLSDQRRDMERLMAKARITPHTAKVHSADDELARITGARVPSGVPVVITVPTAEPRSAGASTGRGGSRRRPRGSGAPATGAARGGAGRGGSGRTGGGTSAGRGGGGTSAGRGGGGSSAGRTGGARSSSGARTAQPRRRAA
ncbi:Superfamily II DNA and RNA helicase [Actinacidiphila yanglinensis]|uniref:Superfamily II DNA and RNA helicase n=1 Tax=Actinacidiphila yanglinensis TaxID=310779 RepID=A0A1H6AHA7_9ACTN|nr:DEAD/DEAH box helicase [Actinacidiphila yanglinensis]SEG48078.1 Superfamily II DNA and RNA helicase [Actinacidiphila yanglinensis]